MKRFLIFTLIILIFISSCKEEINTTIEPLGEDTKEESTVEELPSEIDDKRIEEIETEQKDKNIQDYDKDFNIYDLGDYRIFLHDLSIMFNQRQQEGLIAKSILDTNPKDSNFESNDEFREYFINDMNEIIKNIEGVKNISVYWFYSVDAAIVQLSYKENLTKKEKKEYLDEVKKELESKWYTRIVEYDVVVKLG